MKRVLQPGCIESPCVRLGVWGVGLATVMARVDSVPLGSDQQSWVLTSEGTTLHNGEVISRLSETLAEGDILVCLCVCIKLSFIYCIAGNFLRVLFSLRRAPKRKINP